MRIARNGHKVKTIRGSKGCKVSAGYSSHPDDKKASALVSRKIRRRRRVTAEQIRKANELMMKAWDLISKRNNSAVDV